MLNAIKTELFLRHSELEDKTIKSLYFGGGTPSVLSVDEIKFLTDEVLKYFHFSEDIEITLEANPDDLNANFLKELRTSHINRLSIGTQSFLDADLKLMNRVHSGEEAESSIKRSQDYGFENISIDLIYGSPTSDMEDWKHNLEKTVELQVPHISSYALTVEPNTALNSWIRNGKVNEPKEKEQSEEFYFLIRFLAQNGFEHYEISNFAKPGFYSRHNSAYWKYQPYLGLGPSAHSYDGKDTRSWNKSNNPLYIKDLIHHQLPVEREILSESERYNELMMIGLRTKWGISLKQIEENRFSEMLIRHFEKESQKLKNEGKLMEKGGCLLIPEQHWFMADGIASELFFV